MPLPIFGTLSKKDAMKFTTDVSSLFSLFCEKKGVGNFEIERYGETAFQPRKKNCCLQKRNMEPA